MDVIYYNYYFYAYRQGGVSPQLAHSLITNSLFSLTITKGHSVNVVTVDQLISLLRLLEAGKVTSNAAKSVNTI